MDSLLIEMRSIIKLADCLTRNDRIKPYINANDKTPSWDGEVIVYNQGSIAKETFQGKVPIQIKGSIRNDLSPNKIKYSFETSDLRNYMSSNGIMVFVVCMRDYDDFKIYYNALLPFDLTKIIKEIGNNKSKTIELEEFPKDDQTEVVNIFLNFIRDQKLQGGSVDPDILSLKDVSKLVDIVEGFHFGYFGVGLNNIIDVFNYSLTHPSYVYLKPKGLNIKIPVDKFIAEQISTDVESPVKVNGNIIYDSYKLVYEVGKQILRIGNSFSFNLSNGKVNFSILGTLSERITDIKFLFALYNNEPLEINGVPFTQTTFDSSDFDAIGLEEYLKKLEDIKATLEILGVKKDLIIDNLSEKEFDRLFMLVRAILYNESVSMSVDNNPGIGNLTIGNLVITLICRKSDDGKFTLANYFGDDNIYSKYFDKNDEKEIILSPFLQLKKEDILTISNINYNRIVQSILSLPKSELQDDLANMLVLEMLKAYDEQEEKDPELIQAAQKIIDWLSTSPIHDHITLNKFQIAKRTRELLPEELNVIAQIKSSSSDDMTLTGASILLGSFAEAGLYYRRLTDDKQKDFDSFPITKLWVGK